MNTQASFALRGRNPDVLTCIANLSNDEVFTPPEFANRMLNTLAEAWSADLLDGTSMDPATILEAVAGDTRELVVVTGLPLAGMCAHHLLPFHGVAHVAYRPTGKVTGLSCLGRLVDCYAHRLTIQEQVGREVTDALVAELGAAGAACVLEAQHTCMIARGARQSGARVTTVSLAGTMLQGGPDHALVWAALRVQGAPHVGGHE